MIKTWGKWTLRWTKERSEWFDNHCQRCGERISRGKEFYLMVIWANVEGKDGRLRFVPIEARTILCRKCFKHNKEDYEFVMLNDYCVEDTTE